MDCAGVVQLGLGDQEAWARLSCLSVTETAGLVVVLRLCVSKYDFPIREDGLGPHPVLVQK